MSRRSRKDCPQAGTILERIRRAERPVCKPTRLGVRCDPNEAPAYNSRSTGIRLGGASSDVAVEKAELPC